MTYQVPSGPPWHLIGASVTTVALIALSIYLAAFAPCSWLCSFGVASVPARCIRTCVGSP